MERLQLGNARDGPEGNRSFWQNPGRVQVGPCVSGANPMNDTVSERSEGDGWIKWEGGEESPVDPQALVNVRFRDGSCYGDTPIAGELMWSHHGYAADIIAYR